MSLQLEVQRASQLADLPGDEQLNHWATAAVSDADLAQDLVIRIVDEEESADLNGRYRDKQYATNVLSFPSDIPEEIGEPALGDLVVCAPVVRHEAAEQGKSEAAHWAHMVVHGVLHLQGHDHIEDDEAEAMEAREREILARFDYPDPYQLRD